MLRGVLVCVLICLIFPCAILCSMSCGSTCSSDKECQSYLGNPCTFCYRSVCTPMCGVGCSRDSDCQGGGNPCSICSDKRVCVNPVPQCGSFCGGSGDACKFNGTNICGGPNQDCCYCNPTDYSVGCTKNSTSNLCNSPCDDNGDCIGSTNCTQCVNGACSSSLCGKICASTGECAQSASCPQCVGYFCSPKSSCGQNCISSGQCQANPNNCKACIGTICSNTLSCGAMCGGSDWCGASCPVCSFNAKCSTSTQHELLMKEATKEDIEMWVKQMAEVAATATAANRLRFLGH